MYVVEFYRRHEGLVAYKLFTNREAARTAMIALAHKLNDDRWPEGRGAVEHQDADRIRVKVNAVPDKWGHRFDWYSEIQVVDVPVDAPDNEEWPSYRTR